MNLNKSTPGMIVSIQSNMLTQLTLIMISNCCDYTSFSQIIMLEVGNRTSLTTQSNMHNILHLQNVDQ